MPKIEVDDDDKLVTIYPADGKGYIQEVPKIEQEVTAKEAKRLTSFQPAAFTLTQPKAARASEPEEE